MAKEKYEETELYRLRHSSAHVMAQAVVEMFPGEAKVAIGPPIAEGFYYDFDLPRSLTPEDLEVIESRMRELIKGDFEFEMQMALMNRHLNPSIETILMMPSETYSYLSSRLVKEVFALGGSVRGLVPELVEARLRDKADAGQSLRV